MPVTATTLYYYCAAITDVAADAAVAANSCIAYWSAT